MQSVQLQCLTVAAAAAKIEVRYQNWAINLKLSRLSGRKYIPWAYHENVYGKSTETALR